MTRNVAASVHQRLLNQARARGRPADGRIAVLRIRHCGNLPSVA
jgi:hypothetical protein